MSLRRDVVQILVGIEQARFLLVAHSLDTDALEICIYSVAAFFGRRHSTFGGSGSPCTRNAVRKCIFATFPKFCAPCFSINMRAAPSTAVDAPFGNSTPNTLLSRFNRVTNSSRAK